MVKFFYLGGYLVKYLCVIYEWIILDLIFLFVYEGIGWFIYCVYIVYIYVVVKKGIKIIFVNWNIFKMGF